MILKINNKISKNDDKNKYRIKILEKEVQNYDF